MKPIWLLWLFAPIILSNIAPESKNECMDETDLFGDVAAYISCSLQITNLITFAINTYQKLKPKKIPKPTGQTLNNVMEQVKVDPNAVKIDPDDIEANRETKLQQLREKVAKNLAQAPKLNSYIRQLKMRIDEEQKKVDLEVERFKEELKEVSKEIQKQTKACSEIERALICKIKEVDFNLGRPGLTEQDKKKLNRKKSKIERKRQRSNGECVKYITEQGDWVDLEQERLNTLLAALEQMKDTLLKKKQEHKHNTVNISIGNIEIQALEDLIQLETLHANVDSDQNVQKIKIINARAENRKKQKKQKHHNSKDRIIPYVDVPKFKLRYKVPTDALGEGYFNKIKDQMARRFNSLNTVQLQHGVLYFLSKRGFTSSLPNKDQCWKIKQFLQGCPDINEDTQYTQLLDIVLDLYEEDCVVWKSAQMVEKKWRFGQIPLARDAPEQVGEFYEIQGKDYKIIQRKGRKIASPVSRGIDYEDEEHDGNLTLMQRRFGTVQYPNRHPLGRNPTKPHHLRRLKQKDFKRINNMFNFLKKDRPQVGEGGVDINGRIYMWIGKKWIPSTMKEIKNEAEHMCKRALYKGKPLRGEWSYQHPEKIQKARRKVNKEKIKLELKQRDQDIKMRQKEKQRQA